MQPATTVNASPIMMFRERLIARRDELTHALQGSGVTPDRFIRAATTAVQITPDLAECSFQSLWIALLKACRDQLLPDGVQGAIVPYKRQAQWIPMVRGLLNRFEKSGHYKWITADFHRTDDLEWSIWVDEHGQHFLHRPGSRNGAIIETYACATTINGGFFISVVSNDEMERIRATSRATRDDAPWNMWPEEMKKKTALRRLAKILPMPAPLDLDDDDSGTDETTPAAPTRPPGVAAAFDQIARMPEAEAPAEGVQLNVPEVYLRTAFERGRAARRDGESHDSLPQEYTEPSRTAEADEWRKGYMDQQDAQP